eukprot:5655030-Ditylum_brightwellii.AAC.1
MQLRKEKRGKEGKIQRLKKTTNNSKVNEVVLLNIAANIDGKAAQECMYKMGEHVVEKETRYQTPMKVEWGIVNQPPKENRHSRFERIGLIRNQTRRVKIA